MWNRSQHSSRRGIFPGVGQSHGELRAHVQLRLHGDLAVHVHDDVLDDGQAQARSAHVAAAGLRMKDYAMETATAIQENAADILASAKDLNDERAAREAKEAADAQLSHSEAE